MPYLIKEIPCVQHDEWKAKYWDVLNVEIITVKDGAEKYDLITGKLGSWVTIDEMDSRRIPPVGYVPFSFRLLVNDNRTRAESITLLFQQFQISTLNEDNQETNTFNCCGGLDSCGLPVDFINDTLVT